jgi:hypothetical protein
MPLTLIKEDGTGKADANAYANAADGDAYHAGHLYATAWTAATTGLKEAALVMATRLIDAYIDFGGKKATSGQALQWPRAGCVNPDEPRGPVGLTWFGGSGCFEGTVVPAVVVAATCEMARELLISDRTRPPLGEGLKSSKTSGERTAEELVVNGDFSAPLASPWNWVAGSATAIVSGGFSGNCVQVANYGALPGQLGQSFATVAGRVYRLKAYFKKGTSISGQILIGTTLLDNSIFTSDAYTDAAWDLKTVYFSATSGTTWVTLFNNDTAGANYSLWDGVSVQSVYDPGGGSNFINGDLTLNGLLATELVYDRLGQAPVISRVALALLTKVGSYHGERGAMVALRRV